MDHDGRTMRQRQSGRDRRSSRDRRSGKDRRRLLSLFTFFKGRCERRAEPDRRTQDERRHGWVRFSKWSSVHLPSLKISKYLRPPER